MVLKLYASPHSTCSQRVLTVLAEKDIPYELVPIDLAKGEHKSPEHLARQPYGKVPALDDDGFLIFESRAIAKYLAKKYASQGTKLLPDNDDVKAYGLFEQAASLEENYFNPPAEGIAAEEVFKKFRGLDADPVQVKAHLEALDVALAGYEVVLAKHKYLAGDELSVVDIFHLPYIRLDKSVGHTAVYEKYPNVKRWVETLEALPSWKKVTGQ